MKFYSYTPFLATLLGIFGCLILPKQTQAQISIPVFEAPRPWEQYFPDNPNQQFDSELIEKAKYEHLTFLKIEKGDTLEWVEYTFDAKGRVTEADWKRSEIKRTAPLVETFSYENGQVSRVQSPMGIQTCYYEGDLLVSMRKKDIWEGRVTRSDYQFVYNDKQQLHQIIESLPGESPVPIFTFHYEDAGQPVKVKQIYSGDLSSDSVIIRLTYDEGQKLIGYTRNTLKNGKSFGEVGFEWKYGKSDELIEETARKEAVVSARYKHFYDKHGNLIRERAETDAGFLGETRMKYDGQNRLVEAVTKWENDPVTTQSVTYSNDGRTVLNTYSSAENSSKGTLKITHNAHGLIVRSEANRFGTQKTQIFAYK